MEKNDRPEAFGVFKPVGHIVIAFRDADRLEALATALLRRGFGPDALVHYRPEEMQAQADADLQKAMPLASLGQELNLVKAHRDLAAQGCSFLIVHAPDDEQAEQVSQALVGAGAVSAQRYGRFIIEELDTEPDERQVFESPDRGLDKASTTNS
jgi:hypothetical protein